MDEAPVGQRCFFMVFVDDLTGMSWVRIPKHKFDSSDALENLISEVATRGDLKIANIRTDEGGELEGNF